MKPAPLPIDEVERLQDLVSYQILDTAQEKDYDDIVQLAADICNCPVSSITFVDAARQWFKASINMEEKETTRDISFCSHAILQKDVFVVEDASCDPRFHDYPNVTGGIAIRFYAGAPIVSKKGRSLGTLCVVDTKAKKLEASQAHALRTMASMVSRLLELRIDAKKLVNHSSELIRSALSYQELFDLSSIAQWIYDRDSKRFLRANKAACNLYGYTEEEFLSLKLGDIMKASLTEMRDTKCVTRVVNHKNKDGIKIAVEATLTTVTEKENNLIVASIIDLSEKLQLQKKLIEERAEADKMVENAALSAQLKERKLLGRELHDNITQMLSSTNIYLDIAYSDDELRLDLIQKSQQNLISAIHQVKSLSRRLVNTPVDVEDIHKAIDLILEPYKISKPFDIHYNKKGHLDDLPAESKTAVVRIIQESLHNAAKYSQAGNFWIDLSRNGSTTLEIRDDGKGFNKKAMPPGIGLKNMAERVEGLSGNFSIDTAPGEGTRISIRLPESHH